MSNITKEQLEQIVEIINSRDDLKQMIADYMNGLGMNLTKTEQALIKARFVFDIALGM